MYRIWCERALPSQCASLIAGVATAVSPGDALPATAAGADGVIASSRVRYDGAFFDQFPTVRVVSRTGIGLDNISLPDATAHRVAVCYTPDAPTISTAEHTIALMLAATKHLKRCDRDLRRGQKTDYFGDFQGVELCGLELGLIGLGRIGKRVARIAAAFEMRVKAYDPLVTPDQASALGVELAVSVEDVLRTADIVSLHVPMTPATQNMLNAERLALMKPGAYLVNAARGGLVDQAALLAALESGHLHGAGLDVFPQEPPDPQSPLLHRDDVIATPHIAGATIAGKNRLWTIAITQALQVLRGERPESLANPEVWPLVQPA